MVEIEGNLLTPDHVVARGNGEWSAAGALARSGAELPNTLAHVVYNIKLQEGGQTELGNKVYAVTLGARFDRTDPGKDPMYLEETSKHLHDLIGYSSGHIHLAFGTASVDQHGMPSLYKRSSPPSKIGTEMLLDKEILGAILVSQRVDQNWIDTLSMLRRVHSTWNHVARSICPELTPDTPRGSSQEDEETWLSNFQREQERVRIRIWERRVGPPIGSTNTARYAFNNIRSYPANLNILIETMRLLNWSILLMTEEAAHDAEFPIGNSHNNALYSILSRHVLRPTPYAGRNIGCQRQEHIEIAPCADKVLNLGTSIIATLTQYPHCCPQHLQILLHSLHILTSARQPNEKREKDWQLTLQTAQILRANLHKFDSTDLKTVGAKGEVALLSFVQTYLISHGSPWKTEQSYQGWSEVRAELTMSLYGIIRDLLRLQVKFRYDDIPTAIVNTLLDTTQSDKHVLYGLSLLQPIPILNREQLGSPFDGVILKILRSRWDTNRLSPGLWANGYSQRMKMLSAGEALNAGESAQLTQLTTAVMTHYADWSVNDHQEGERRISFLQTGSAWLRDLAVQHEQLEQHRH